MSYEKVTASVQTRLRQIVGAAYVLTERETMLPYSHDEVTDPSYHHLPEAVVLPASAEETAAVVKLANTCHIPVVPRGGGTGLACGAVPIYGGIVLSTERLNHICEIRPDGLYAVVEAGVRTADLQAAAEARGLFYAGDPCSGDSCCIGGNIATNAGGNRAVKYGTTRHQIYALQIVNPTGHILSVGAPLRKQSTGYCLEQLLAGSEGTLGIITQATLKLFPKPPYCSDILAVFPTAEAAVTLASTLLQKGILPTCVEFLDQTTLHAIADFLQEPLPRQADGHYVIIEMESADEDERDRHLLQLDEYCRAGGASQVLLAEYKKIWHLRKSFAEAVRAESLCVSKEDVVVPIEREAELLQKIAVTTARYRLTVRLAAHAGDGNLHLNILKPPAEDYDAWQRRVQAHQQELYTYIYQLGGRLSGEHGIGYKRKQLMKKFTNPEELAMMKAIKQAWDPNNILNPGKIFDLP